MGNNMREDLKNYNNELAYFVLFNIALFIWIELDFKFIIENYELLSVLLTIPLYYFPIYLFNNLMPSDWKFFVLYPLKHNHHYASDIFTKIDSGKIKVKKALIDIDLIINYGLNYTITIDMIIRFITTINAFYFVEIIQ